VAHPLVRIPFTQLRPDLVSRTSCTTPSPDSTLSDAQDATSDFLAGLPCVLYECSAALRIIRVSPNAAELIGVRPEEIIGTRTFWEDRVLPEDRGLLSAKLAELEVSDSASIIHRIIDSRGLPLWIAHSFRRVPTGASNILHGCIIPLRGEKRVQDVDRGIVSRFVHKIGNHFQLLNLVVNSLRRGLPESKEAEVLRQTVEKAIELTRTFSDYCQGPTWLSEVDLAEVLNAAIITRKSSFHQRGVELEVKIEDSVRGLAIQGDAFLLESAIAGILQNALEATDSGGRVVLAVNVEFGENDYGSVAKVRVVDTGCGIQEPDLSGVTVPFFSSKKGHEGLGLSMASRFIEMHGGVLRIDSVKGKGTAVDIILPTNIATWPVDR
jgi:signal transduction histidine kinase